MTRVIGLPGLVEVVPKVCGRELMIPHTKLRSQKPNAPLVVFSVPSKRPSVLTFRARKNRNPASFVPQVNTAADDNVTLKHVDENRVGKEASAKAPVPNRSK